jgi:MFS superfamily sulfate permease-like transporter
LIVLAPLFANLPLSVLAAIVIAATFSLVFSAAAALAEATGPPWR